MELLLDDVQNECTNKVCRYIVDRPHMAFRK